MSVDPHPVPPVVAVRGVDVGLIGDEEVNDATADRVVQHHDPLVDGLAEVVQLGTHTTVP